MLERSEFCVDHEEAAKIAASTKERCDTLRAQIERENLARQLVRHRLIKEFWDPMAVKGCKICSLMPESTLSVSNYPVRKETQEEQGIIQKLKVMRRVEQLESQTLRGNHCPRGLQGDALLVADSFSSRQEQYIVNWWPSKTEGDGNQENAKLLYEPFELLTNSRRRLQVFLLQALACDFRLAFNKLFEAAQGDKRATMDQIKEKTARIRAILSELQVDELVEEPRLQDCEDADSVLHVKDGEISVAKWISEEERQRLAEAAAKEEERQRQLRENDAGQRALAQMMGGTLKTKKDLSALEITLDKEPWMDQVPEEDMTELQVAALREFREKEKALAEEQDKYRKQLDAELKRLRQEVQDFTQQFEASLKDLHHQRFAHDAKFFCQELYCVRLQLALLQNLEDHSDVQRIGKDLGEARAQLSKASGELETFQEFIGRARERQDECIRNEKEAASAQNFKQQFAQSGLEPEQIGALLQIFRKKRRMSTQMLSPDATLSGSASPQTRKFRGMSFHGSDTAATKTGPLAPEPFDPEVVMDAYDDLGTVAAESALERAVPKDDEPVDACPEGIDEANYKRMLEMRQRREALEREVAKNSLVLQDMQGLLAHLEKERGDAQVAHNVLQEELDEQLQLMDKDPSSTTSRCCSSSSRARWRCRRRPWSPTTRTPSSSTRRGGGVEEQAHPGAGPGEGGHPRDHEGIQEEAELHPVGAQDAGHADHGPGGAYEGRPYAAGDQGAPVSAEGRGGGQEQSRRGPAGAQDRAPQDEHRDQGGDSEEAARHGRPGHQVEEGGERDARKEAPGAAAERHPARAHPPPQGPAWRRRGRRNGHRGRQEAHRRRRRAHRRERGLNPPGPQRLQGGEGAPRPHDRGEEAHRGDRHPAEGAGPAAPEDLPVVRAAAPGQARQP
ncbi:unnamed protein product [Prorocentrum cordatum]|uniref:Uncharacterized protein n=1 Tax=Prorocentrum cordatum TaxID=2364126 RepID=A0ABN9X3W5_9DINO|nr:unnamed protein product [Polarella glacialis]